MSEPLLEPRDFDNPLFRKLATMLRQREIDHLKQIASPVLGKKRTQVLRGQIKELNYILSLAEPPMEVDESPLELVPESSDPGELV